MAVRTTKSSGTHRSSSCGRQRSHRAGSHCQGGHGHHRSPLRGIVQETLPRSSGGKAGHTFTEGKNASRKVKERAAKAGHRKESHGTEGDQATSRGPPTTTSTPTSSSARERRGRSGQGTRRRRGASDWTPDSWRRGGILQHSLSVQRTGHRSCQGRIRAVHRPEAPRYKLREFADVGNGHYSSRQGTLVPQRVQSRSSGTWSHPLQEVSCHRVTGGPGGAPMAGRARRRRSGRTGGASRTRGCSAGRSRRRTSRCQQDQQGGQQGEGQEKGQEEKASKAAEKIKFAGQQEEKAKSLEPLEKKRRREGQESSRWGRGEGPCEEQFIVQHELFDSLHTRRSEEDVSGTANAGRRRGMPRGADRRRPTARAAQVEMVPGSRGKPYSGNISACVEWP